MAGFLALLGPCLRDLGAVLTGQKSATDVLFPGASPHLVQGIYRGNPFADRTNLLLAQLMRAILSSRKPGSPLRILEVGAGTGSATAFVLDALPSLASQVSYCYTDLSLHFLDQGRQAFQTRFPFVDYRLLDLEKDPLAQGFEPAGFDLILASNVLHATAAAFTRASVRLKSLLRRRGLLLLKENVTVQDFATLTFGLTDGWWLHDDTEQRLPHAPLLSYAQWQQVLAENGFQHAQGVGLIQGPDRPMGEAVIVSASDGWGLDQPAEPAVPVAASRPTAPTPTPVKSAGTNDELRSTAQRSIRSAILPSLKMHESELEDHVPLEQYGVDSLVAIDIVRRLSEQVGPLPPTVLFDHQTIDALTDYLLSQRPVAFTRSQVPAVVTSATGDDVLVSLCTTGSATPSFWVHSIVGEYSWVVRLSRHLGVGWPVYAFQLRGWSGQPFTTLAELVAVYVAALRKAQPNGPYVLGGYSAGGLLAFEMAHQLHRLGERVSCLVLLDSIAPGSRSLQALREAAVGGALLIQAAANMLALQWKGEPVVTAEMLPLGDREAQVEAAAGRLHAACPTMPSLDSVRQALLGLMATMERLAELLDAYQPSPYPSELRTLLFRNTLGFVGESGMLLRSQFAGVDSGRRHHGWGRWLPTPPEVVEIAANHFNLGQEPAIGLIAQELARRLEPQGYPPLTAPPTPPASSLDQVFAAVRRAVQQVLPEVPAEAITPEVSLRHLGANSIDRVEIANAALEELNIDIPRTTLGNLRNLGALVEALCAHLPAAGLAASP